MGKEYSYNKPLLWGICLGQAVLIVLIAIFGVYTYWTRSKLGILDYRFYLKAAMISISVLHLIWRCFNTYRLAGTKVVLVNDGIIYITQTSELYIGYHELNKVEFPSKVSTQPKIKIIGQSKQAIILPSIKNFRNLIFELKERVDTLPNKRDIYDLNAFDIFIKRIAHSFKCDKLVLAVIPDMICVCAVLTVFLLCLYMSIVKLLGILLFAMVAILWFMILDTLMLIGFMKFSNKDTSLEQYVSGNYDFSSAKRIYRKAALAGLLIYIMACLAFLSMKPANIFPWM